MKPAFVDRLVIPAATVATAIAITALFGTCGHEAPRVPPSDDRNRAAEFVAICDAALETMGRDYAKVAPELSRLVSSDRAAALAYLEQHVATIVAYPIETCNSARALVNRVFEAQPKPDLRIREDGARLMMQEPRLREAQESYLALHTALGTTPPPDVRPLVDALASALR